jgi:hypothetical protein
MPVARAARDSCPRAGRGPIGNSQDPPPPLASPDPAGDASGLLSDMLAAVAGTIRVAGCASAREFTEGVFRRLVDQDPRNKAQLKAAFQGNAALAKCKYAFDK